MMIIMTFPWLCVDDQTTMHAAGLGMSTANPVQIGKFVLEDGKVLTLSRKSSPSRNCIDPYPPCGALDWCCEGLKCDGIISGKCYPMSFCSASLQLDRPIASLQLDRPMLLSLRMQRYWIGHLCLV
uniref:Acyl transferase/acyl hydrolase/lysophospholipase n=1 Tax=Tanacetum cinerariifolium TaxID=118510 RepID=A0A6L2JLM3_TANCI|nr:acyl transferase/acyl hydrolase/lysophospholipase [Tanacetum cinerariifolium]